MLNIPSHIKDPNYRYKMPKIVVTSQGTGNGIKTKLDNIIDVSKALNMPPEYPLKFMGYELGSQTEVKAGIYLINGNHQAEKLQQILDKLIDKYILCTKCKLPEIRIFIKREEIRGKCWACGNICKLDEKHKLANHIKNFPPKYDESANKSMAADGDKLEKKKEESRKMDKQTKENIRSYMDKVSKAFAENIPLDTKRQNIEKTLEEAKFEIDLRYFVLINGVFDKNIYRNIKNMWGFLKYFIEKEQNRDEGTYHLLGSLADLTINRFKDVPAINKQIPSILYYLYMEDVITEEFWIKFAIKGNIPSFNSLIFTRELENKFLQAATDFTNWIENAPYEDEEEVISEKPKTSTKKGEVKETPKAKVEEEIDIDDI